MIESSAHPVPDNAPETRLAELDGRLSAVERSSVDSWAVNGVRSDLSPDQWGVRVRHGLLPDGVYGYEMFTEDGKRCRNGHWAGEVFFFAGASVPEGCEEADGGTVDGTTDKYLYLWRAIGTVHGGSGQSSFAKPNLRGRVPVGKAASGTFVTLGATGGAETDSTSLSSSNLPSHTHPAGTLAVGSHTHGGAFTSQSTGTTTSGGGLGVVTGVFTGNVNNTAPSISGSTGATGSSTSFLTSTLQPYLVLLPIVSL